MSLNWDATNAPNWEPLDWNVKESLIFSCMAVDIGEITEANHEEWYGRYLQMYLAAGWGDPYLTLQDVRNGIGLKTNVHTTTKAAWRKRMVTRLEESAETRIRRLKLEEEKEKEETDA